jgi:hypothetical protein
VTIPLAGTTVSGTLDLQSGSYVLSAKLHLSRPAESVPPPFNVTCVLVDQAMTVFDSATVTVAAGESRTLTLSSTAVLERSASFFVTCVPSGDDASANSIQLIAIRVDSVSEQTVP